MSPNKAFPQGPRPDDLLPLPAQHFGQRDRTELIAQGAPFRKTARIIAVRIQVPFTVETGAGMMRGEAGDWLATNHPADDPGSDVWVISAERMAATYQPAE